MSYQYTPGNPWFNPGYRYSNDRPTEPVPSLQTPAKCECGSEKAGCGEGAHSDWCPKAPKP